MKLYTTADQTKHLIELGFKRPVGTGYNYSIGELISFLVNPVIEGQPEVWIVSYDSGIKNLPPFIEEELVDALYETCIHSKKIEKLYDKERTA